MAKYTIYLFCFIVLLELEKYNKLAQLLPYILEPGTGTGIPKDSANRKSHSEPFYLISN